MITEFVKFQALETTTQEQLISKIDILNDFQKKQDGYLDAELVKDIKENFWYIIYHYENFEKVKIIGEKLRSNNLFDEFTPLLVQGSLQVTFHQNVKKW
jgi:ABC-type uncharacterized transport system substrate-binding protein